MDEEGAMLEHRDADPSANRISYSVIGAAIEVHKELGPGLLESSYQECLAYELRERGHRVELEMVVPLTYKGVCLKRGYRIDLLVDDMVVVEAKAQTELTDVHRAQILTYLRMTGKPLGLLINFHVPYVREGIERFVLTPPSRGLRASAPSR